MWLSAFYTVDYILGCFSAEFSGVLQFYTISEYVCGEGVCLSEMSSEQAKPGKDLILPTLSLRDISRIISDLVRCTYNQSRNPWDLNHEIFKIFI